jgi:hypothetical protein
MTFWGPKVVDQGCSKTENLARNPRYYAVSGPLLAVLTKSLPVDFWSKSAIFGRFPNTEFAIVRPAWVENFKKY